MQMTNDDIVRTLAEVVPALAPVSQPLDDSLGCVLANDVDARFDLPPRALASRDGIALRAADVAAASPTRPLVLPVAGTSAPGDAVGVSLPPGQAWQVMTGAALPPGADAVLRHEDVLLENNPDSVHSARVTRPATAGQYVAHAGSEFTAGARVVVTGTVLGPAELAALAAQGLIQVRVVPRPRVSIIVTGSELREGGNPDGAGGLHASNAVLVSAMVRSCGARVMARQIVADEHDLLERAFDAALQADLVLSTGGTGRAARDRVGQVLRMREAADLRNLTSGGSRPAGIRLLRRGPGGPAVPHVALPGRPIAAVVAFTLFAAPLLRHLAGEGVCLPRYVDARLVGSSEAVRLAQRFVPVRLHQAADGLDAVATGDAALYGLAATLGADGFALLARGGDSGDAAPLLRVLLAPWGACKSP